MLKQANSKWLVLIYRTYSINLIFTMPIMLSVTTLSSK